MTAPFRPTRPSPLQEARLGQVVDRFYEAATRPELWRTVLHEASLALGAEGAILLSYPNPALGMVWSEGTDELIRTFAQGHWENTRAARGFPHRQWDLHTEASLFAFDELDRVPFYAELLEPLGFRWFAGTTLAKVGDNSILISVERRAHQEPFSGSELSSVTKALPHLRRASELALRVGLTRSEGMLDGLSLLSCGGILLDWLGRVIGTNGDAERHLGSGIACARGYLQVSHRDANAALQKLIGSVLHRGPASEAPALGPVALPRHNAPPLIAHAVPIVGAAHDIFQGAKAILMLADPGQHREPAEPILRQSFSLTPAEARLAIALARGQDLSETAATAQITLGTARTQLKSIFAKTGTRRQGELVALLGRYAVVSGSAA